MKNKILAEFRYYKPKDIVSGDFYWINEKNGLFYPGGIDCTGHGVPGAFMEEEICTYKNHTFQLEKGDIVYLFSDGYSDQFGGIHGKKYMKRKFKIFLSRVSNLPMEEQKELLDDEHTRWKGNFQQVDDILVFGIRTGFI